MIEKYLADGEPQDLAIAIDEIIFAAWKLIEYRNNPGPYLHLAEIDHKAIYRLTQATLPIRSEDDRDCVGLPWSARVQEQSKNITG